MTQLPDHPAVARCLRTGYPAPVRPVENAGVITVADEEFAEILESRISKSQRLSDKTDRKA